MNDNKVKPIDIYKKVLIDIHKASKEKDYITKDAIMVESLSEKSFKCADDWLKDSEFYETFKGNMVGYYLGISVNLLCLGMTYASMWANSESSIGDIKYDSIYDGGVWNNIFVLMEMKTDNEKKDFQNFVIELYESWVVTLKDYIKHPNANEYITISMSAFFALGVTLVLDILGY